ncbi:hypothetical protein MMYC01_205332 [Madurella mycetomatis]|uniref:Uncharacterized protein n=1 Tax=Madurella mycetomatis TaxID=100816 RepID=A0A175VZ67_9PEZI|nr:hypothetical protein MMYC01_205332 [Madurella mycetomatis]
MEKHIFDLELQMQRSVTETTTGLEILSYSDATFNSVQEHPLDFLETNTFSDFLHRRGNFAPPTLPDGVRLVAGVRLVLQLPAKHPDTFQGGTISMPGTSYAAMIAALRLPRIAIEASYVVGPFFWFTLESEGERPHFQMIFRKSDVRRRGLTRGWEMMLSHELETGVTTGFCKGTPLSGLEEAVSLMKACISDLGHPLLLPLIMLGSDSKWKAERHQRDAREWLRKMEHVIAMRDDIETESAFVAHGVLDIDAINRDLVECHAQVLWKRPSAYISVIDSMKQAAALFIEKLQEKRDAPGMERLQQLVELRLGFYKRKWEGVEVYANTTLQRLEIQRDALYNIIAQKESKLSLRMAVDQMRLANTSKRDSEAVKGISLIGAIFLPGTFLSSIFSTTFFDFQAGPTFSSVISPRFWLYWAVGIPFTLLVVGLYFMWEQRRARQYAMEDRDTEMALENLEAVIISQMRKRTLGKLTTWGERYERRERLAADDENDFGAAKLDTSKVPTVMVTAPTLKP